MYKKLRTPSLAPQNGGRFSLTSALMKMLARSQRRGMIAREIQQLRELSDHQLHDIGLDADDIKLVVRYGRVNRDSTANTL